MTAFVTPPRPSAAERLASGLVLNTSGCLEWTGRTDDGYGQISVNGKNVGTHRLAWIVANGPIPEGLCVLHHCDNPPCAQTDPTDAFPEGHLFLGTRANNSADRDAKGRTNNGQAAKTHCPQGHPYDEANTYVSRPGKRTCKTCSRSASTNYKRRKAADAPLLTPTLENTVHATVEVLTPWETLALTVAHSQVKRGITPEPNVTAVCVMVLARLTGRDGPS